MPRRATTKKKATPLKQTEDGLHLLGSILWFDSKGSGDLSFLSSAIDKTQSRVPQVIATEETVRILETYRKKPNALICQYNRPFSIGRLKMELLPSGCVLGGASLYVETDEGRLLYAPQLQIHRIPTVRQMQLKKANTLILGAWHPNPDEALPNRKKEKERLLKSIQDHLARGVYPILLAEPVATAQEITKLLTDHQIPLAVHDSIFRVNHIYEDFGSSLGHYTRYSRKYTKKKVTIFPLSNHNRTVMLRSALPEGPLLYVADTTHAPPPAQGQASERYYISSSFDGSETKEIITAVSPKELYFFGPYAKRYVEKLAGLCPRVDPLFVNDQPTLF